MNIPNMKLLLDKLKSVKEEQFDMDFWYRCMGDLFELDSNRVRDLSVFLDECGITVCIVGWARTIWPQCKNTNGVRRKLGLKTKDLFFPVTWSNFGDIGEEAYRISERETHIAGAIYLIENLIQEHESNHGIAGSAPILFPPKGVNHGE